MFMQDDVVFALIHFTIRGFSLGALGVNVKLEQLENDTS